MRGGTLAGFPEPLRGIPVRERPLTPSPPPILPPSLAHRGRNPIRKGRGWKWQELSNVYKPGFRPCRSPLSPPPRASATGALHAPPRPRSVPWRLQRGRGGACRDVSCSFWWLSGRRRGWVGSRKSFVSTKPKKRTPSPLLGPLCEGVLTSARPARPCLARGLVCAGLRCASGGRCRTLRPEAASG